MTTLFACHDGADPSPIENVYFDSATGEIFVFNQGQKIVVGGVSLPGVTGDGLTPSGLNVAGAMKVGTSHSATWEDSNVYGSVTVQDTPGSAAAANRVAYVLQGTALQADSFIPAVHVARTAVLNGHVFGEPVVLFYNATFTASDIILQLEANAATGPYGYDDHIAMQVNSAGGLGIFGKTPPTAPRTLAQATINAITDANAKAAVQALANTLADMGALTLT